MEQRTVGRSGLKVSHLALGTMTWGVETDADEAAAQLVAFHDAGGTLVDTAASYGYGETEEMFGQLLADVVPRSELVIATKAGITRTAEGRFVDCLTRRVAAHSWTSRCASSAPTTSTCGTCITSTTRVPFDETLSALDAAVRAGKVRYVGRVELLRLAHRHARRRGSAPCPDGHRSSRTRCAIRCSTAASSARSSRPVRSSVSASSRGHRSAAAYSPASTAAGCRPTHARPAPTAAAADDRCAANGGHRRSGGDGGGRAGDLAGRGGPGVVARPSGRRGAGPRRADARPADRPNSCQRDAGPAASRSARARRRRAHR